jgi:hypothetical protein
MVKIFPRVVVHTKKLIHNETLTFHILLHGKKEVYVPEEERMRRKDFTSKDISFGRIPQHVVRHSHMPAKSV